MKAPGILYRISFLVIINAIFIFVAVTLVNVENNQAKIDRLITYKSDFIRDYYRAELMEAREDHSAVEDSRDVGAAHLSRIFNHSSRFMAGLAGLSLLTPRTDAKGYCLEAVSFRESFGTLDERMAERIATEADRENLQNLGIHLGGRFTNDLGTFKTIYIPWEEKNPDLVLAITYMPGEIYGSLLDSNYVMVVLFLAITLISLLIINLLFKDFIQPLQHLVMGMEKTAKGELLYTIEEVRNDDIGRVTAAFNTMSSTIWDKRRQLTESNASLQKLNVRLTDTLEQLSAANRSLGESEAFLSNLIASAPFGVIATNPEGKIIIFSHAALSTFEISEEEALGKPIAEFFPYAPDKILPAAGEKVGFVEREMICGKHTGESFPALVTRVAIREDAEKMSAYLFIIRDISESRGFQEMMISIDRMATRGVMAGEIAHEINNYLAIILGNVELVPLLLSKGKMDKVDQKLDILRQTVTKIQRFSEGLMGYGNDEAVCEPGDLNQLIENLVTFLRPQNRYDTIKIDLDLSHEIPLVAFDSSQLQQLFVNLFNNAADALRDRAEDRHLTITTSVNPGRETVAVTVADNAGGLPDDLQDVIFRERYTGKRRGRGFGLLIIKRILDKHQGEISYETTPGDGTSFTLTLPIRRRAVADEEYQASQQVTT